MRGPEQPDRGMGGLAALERLESRGTPALGPGISGGQSGS